MELSEIDLRDEDDSHSPRREITFNPSGIETINMTLVWNQTQCLKPKNFSEEVRGPMDVLNFLSQSVPLLLDVNADHLSKIVDLLLEAILADYQPEQAEQIRQETNEVLFTDDLIQQFASTMQGTVITEGGGVSPDQGWILAMGQLLSIQRRHVAIARLDRPVNLEPAVSEARFVIIVLAPQREKGTKNAIETSRTFATLFADVNLRNRLLRASTTDEFKQLLLYHTRQLMDRHSGILLRRHSAAYDVSDLVATRWHFTAGIVGDVKRRWPHYLSDYIDGITGQNTLQKVISTIFFLYFACLLPAIAFGVLYSKITAQQIGVEKLIISQAVGGVLFAVFGGQPMIILLSTAPLAIYTKVIFSIAEERQFDGLAFYSCVGLWNAGFLALYSVLNLCKVIQWSSRHTEEIFALFISVAFVVDSTLAMTKNFDENYNSPACSDTNTSSSTTNNVTNSTNTLEACGRDNSILSLALLLGTVWVSSTLFEFRKSPYLDANKREFLSDYALPLAVVLMSFIGSYVAKDIELERFIPGNTTLFTVPHLTRLPASAVFLAMVLGLVLSLLFFIDQNISAAMVNSSKNNLQKGPSYHLDLAVVAGINGLLSLFGLAWVHAALPHSPLHVRSLADVDERVDQGHVYDMIVRVRETRLTGLLSHVFIGLSVLMIPVPLHFIPTPVLYGLFVYIAITALNGNQLFERILLFVTEQYAYPPNHYIRTVPQRKIHLFTVIQLCQLAVVCFFGFFPNPYVKMVFPVIIMLLLPTRYWLIPKLIDGKYLSALDGNH